MKYTVKIFALMISIVVFISPLTSCKSNTNDALAPDATPTASVKSTNKADAEKEYLFEIVCPPFSLSSFKFKPIDGKLKEYKTKLEKNKKLINKR